MSSKDSGKHSPLPSSPKPLKKVKSIPGSSSSGSGSGSSSSPSKKGKSKPSGAVKKAKPADYTANAA